VWRSSTHAPSAAGPLAGASERPGGPAGVQVQRETVDGFAVTTHITPEDIEGTMSDIVKGGTVTRPGKPHVRIPKHPDVHFKVKVHSCFSQRFAYRLTRE